jgi:hypothetical protein
MVPSADLWADWSREIADTWSTATPTGGVSPHVDGELRTDRGTHIAGWYIG